MSSIPSLLTKKQFLEKHQAFTKGGLDFQLFHRKKNGLVPSGAVLQNGRRILIDEEKYFAWLKAQQEDV